MKIKILAHTPNPERVIALAGKLCYSPVGIDELNDKMIDKINELVEAVNQLKNVE